MLYARNISQFKEPAGNTSLGFVVLAGQVLTNQVKERLFLALIQSEPEINPGNERYCISGGR